MTIMSSQLCEMVFVLEHPLSATTFKAVQNSLFLPPDDRYSRLDVYAPSMVQETAPRGKDDIQVTSAAPDAATGHGSADDFRITEMKQIRTVDEITRYQLSAPNFRAFFIRQRFSYSALLINADLFRALLRLEKISPQLKDYLVYYGERNREVEVAPPILKFRPLAWSMADSQILGHECMYGLRFFELNGRGRSEEPTSQWSLRQTAVYSRSGSGTDGNIWLFTRISPAAQRRLDRYVNGSDDIGHANPFEIHLLLMDTATANWRFFLVALSSEIDEEVAHIAGTSSSDEGPSDLFNANRRQHLIYLEEKVSTALLVARATVETIEELSRNINMAHDNNYTSRDCAIITAGLTEQRRTLVSTILRLETMKAKLKASTSLLSSLLEQNSGHALEVLGQESRKENAEMRELSERMHKLTEKATQDAAAVKVLTIMTLIYLPATVVSNFFSTSFVTTASSPGGANHIVVLSDWWIFVVVSVPLTIITLYIWWVWTRMKTHGRHPWYLGFLQPRPDNTQRAIGPDLELGGEKSRIFGMLKSRKMHACLPLPHSE